MHITSHTTPFHICCSVVVVEVVGVVVVGVGVRRRWMMTHAVMLKIVTSVRNSFHRCASTVDAPASGVVDATESIVIAGLVE